MTYLKTNGEIWDLECDLSFVGAREPGSLALRLTAPTSDSSIQALPTNSPLWKIAAGEATVKTISGRNFYPEDTSLLLILSSFLGNFKISFDLLRRGAGPSKRWDERGEVKVDALCTDLVPELIDLLSDGERLSGATRELESLSAVSMDSHESYMLEPGLAARVIENLDPVHHSFWRQQALIIAYRSIPWKYLESSIPNTRELFLPHLRYTLQNLNGSSTRLSIHTKTDLVATLVEGCRFSNLEWKRFALAEAKDIMLGLKDQYLGYCIANRESILHRISGHIDDAKHSVQDIPANSAAHPMIHAAVGQTVLQRSLNCIQVEDLTGAADVIKQWKPLRPEPSTIESIVVLRQNMILGRVARFRGEFMKSKASLETALRMADYHKDLSFGEDRCDIVCDLADSLHELKEYDTAQHYLSSEIARRCTDKVPTLIKLTLAELLFTKGQFTEAATICQEVQSRSNLTKIETLRLSITLAKLHHLHSDWENAFEYWTDATTAASKFTLTGGDTTRIIINSICDILRHQGQNEILNQTHKQLSELEELSGPGETRFWIAGLRNWEKYLQERANSSSHLEC